MAQQQTLTATPAPHARLQMTSGTPMAILVSDKVKGKVWANQFVDMATVLDREAEQPHVQIQLLQDNGSVMNSLTIHNSNTNTLKK